MKPLALLFLLAGLGILASCNPFTGPIKLFADCSPSNCPPPGSCQVPQGHFVPTCLQSPNSLVGAGVTLWAIRR
jgi:hypothetical protein